MKNFFSSLYVHVPFCFKKCKYCSFYSIAWNEELEKIYIEAILKEIEIVREIPNRLETIYIGGGTPTSLTSKAFRNLVEKIMKSFNISNNLEFSVELNPTKVDTEILDLMNQIGVNRVSVGVQSFNNEELGILGRSHSSEEARNTIKRLLKSRFENISVDLLYGIPTQSMKTWENTLKESLSLDITHISIYELTVDEGTELEREIVQKKYVLPDEEMVSDMYLLATEILESRGLRKYEISNFAFSNFECRHNITYWRRRPYLGIGPSSHSFLFGKRFYNPKLFDYSKVLLRDELAWIFEPALNDLDEFKEEIILRLRMKEGMSINNSCLYKLFKNFENFGLAHINKNIVSLTDRGMLLSNEIFKEVLFHIEVCPVCKNMKNYPK